MDKTNQNDELDLTLSQIAWVVKDVEKSKVFFQEVLGIKHFDKTTTTRLQDYGGTYYGESVNAENLVTMTYAAGLFIELIQPVSGKSIFQDYIDGHPTGGVQHIAYTTPIDNFDKVIAAFEHRGISLVSSFDTSIAKIVFFDTRKEIGVFTEILGMTAKGAAMFKK